MKKSSTILAFILLTILSISCNKTEKTRLTGTLGALDATISLQQEGDKFTGTFEYFDKTISADLIALSGTRLEETLRLEEFNNDENTLTGIFTGNYDGNVFIGHWKAPHGGKKVPFKFSTEETVSNAPATKTNGIEYVLIEHPEGMLAHQGIFARFNNKKYEIIKPKSEELRCIDIYKIADFDKDGLDDVLMIDIVACGGNCCPNEYFFCSYKEENDQFVITENFGTSWGDPIIEDHSGTLRVKLVDNTQGAGFTGMEEVTTVHILEKNKAKLLETKEREQIVAITEIRASKLSESDKDQGALLKFDLNRDGEVDLINATYWERWGTLNWEVSFADIHDGTVCSGSGKRIGVLPTTTNGVHDLVNGFDEIYAWNGERYALKKH